MLNVEFRNGSTNLLCNDHRAGKFRVRLKQPVDIGKPRRAQGYAVFQI